MPIGKNAIKRVSNNGYSSVKSTAPDMENSVVAEPKANEAPKTLEAPKKPTEKKATKVSQKAEAKASPKAEPKAATKQAPKAEPKKAEAQKKAPAKKPTPKKSLEKEPTLSPVNTAKAVVGEKTNERNGDGYVNLGGELPYYLL